jgi:transcriptional regulator with XRE-family HTH domain
LSFEVNSLQVGSGRKDWSMVGVTTVLNLEQARKRSGMSLEAIAEATKISSRFLRAIESEEFEKLPGGIFDTSYIKQYAAAIGYCDREILCVYVARSTPAEVTTDPVPNATRAWTLRSCFEWLLNLPSTAQRA